MRPGTPPRDPGLQPERTALAWQRTGAAGTALAGGSMVTAAARVGAWGVLATALLTAACAAGVVVAARRGRADHGEPSPWARLLAVAAVPPLVAATGILLSLTPH